MVNQDLTKDPEVSGPNMYRMWSNYLDFRFDLFRKYNKLDQS